MLSGAMERFIGEKYSPESARRAARSVVETNNRFRLCNVTSVRVRSPVIVPRLAALRNV